MKLPFTFGTNQLLFRLVFPGLLLAMALAPLMLRLLRSWGAELGESEYLGFTYFGLVALFTGWAISLCDMPIHMFYEGRRFWPRPLLQLGVWLERWRLERLQARADSALGRGDRHAYLEASVDISRFPLDADGQPYAAMPTRLGNLIYEYETYPSTKYGLDSVFFFYRIWVSLDDDLRDEVDRKQAAVDSAIYISFSLGLASLLLVGYGLADVRVPGLTEWEVFLLAAGCLAVGHLVYRLSLHAHAQFGEFYKALFDQYRDLIKRDEVLAYLAQATGDRGLAEGDVTERNRTLWRYLRWHRVRPTGTSSNRNFEDVVREHRERGAAPAAAPVKLSTHG